MLFASAKTSGEASGSGGGCAVIVLFNCGDKDVFACATDPNRESLLCTNTFAAGIEERDDESDVFRLPFAETDVTDEAS